MRQGVYRLTKGDIRKFKEWLKVRGWSEVRLKGVRKVIRMYQHGRGYLIYCCQKEENFVDHYKSEGLSYSLMRDWFREVR